MLKEKILNKQQGVLLYGLTPPKISHPREKLLEISQKQVERINSVDIDGLVIYDIQDEPDRVGGVRPFPFIETVDPVIYAEEYLREVDLPKIIYRCVGKYTPEQFTSWLKSEKNNDRYSVFVGATSSRQAVKLSLSDAYRIYKENPTVILGGVAIPERHITKKDEHLRITGKCAKGCTFFITQVTYNAGAAKDFLSDYYYYCLENNIQMVPIVFTLTPCGSMQTLEFMKWLGISFPGWLENDLKHSEDILDKSLDLSKEVYREILAFSNEKKIPAGCHIESVSTRKVEIDASIQLLKDIKAMIAK